MENSFSPSYKKPEQTGELTFYDALKKMLEGRRISKREWGNPEEYGLMKAEILHIHRNGEDHRWVISEADIVGEDYFVLTEEL